MRVSWTIPLVAGGCFLFDEDTDPPERACPADVQALVDRFDRPDETGGCLELFVAGLVRDDGSEALLTLDLPLGEELAAPGTRVYEPGEVFIASITDGIARATLQVAPDLSRNWPCSHLPLAVDVHGHGTEGEVRVTVVAFTPAADLAPPEVEVDVQARDLRIALDDATTCAVPDLAWRGVDVPLVSE